MDGPYPISYLRSVKKLLIYILLPIFMFNSSIGELFKLPQFFSHFTEHRAFDKDINVFDFIFMHYLGNDLNDNDQDKDMQLPFKKVDCYFSFQIAAFPNSKFIPERFVIVNSYLKIVFKNHRPKNPTLMTLFRPPCLV